MKCDNPQISFNGYIESLSNENNSSQYLIGSIVKFSCPSDLILRGSRTSKCQYNGSWLPKIPKCESMLSFRTVSYTVSFYSVYS